MVMVAMGLSALHLKLLILAFTCTLTLTLTAVAVAVAVAVAPQSKEGCQSSCGNLLNIPYPFGTREGCYRDSSFFINCTSNSSTSGHHIAYLGRGNIQVLNISLHTGELVVSGQVSRDCYWEDGSFRKLKWATRLGKFAVSSEKNKFTVVGCDTYAYLKDFEGNRFATGCMLNCSDITDVTNGTCSGVGCCQTTFPKAIMRYNVSVRSYYNHTYVKNFNPCGYAFLVEDGVFNFTSQDLLDLRNKTEFPVLLNWAVQNMTCTEANNNLTSYACKHNTRCLDSDSGLGYLCQCQDGFQGNPYLSHQGGCQDIDECKTPSNNCSEQAECYNFNGGYNCSCRLGYKGDGYKNGTGCTPTNKSNYNMLILQISLGVSVGLLVVFTLASSLCWVHKQRTLKQLRRRYFEQNGGKMLLQQLSQQERISDRTKIFTEVELENATNNFHESRILGRGGQGTVYKGIIADNMPVAIKRSRVGGDPRQIKDFINEVAVLSQINHRNVVKLLGCCLETEVPLLVYEFVDKGTLLDHIDPLNNESSLPWETRLRIAAETAEAVSYLHSAASIPIIHRDIKSANILLDHNHRAKVSDFGASRLVPLDETQVTTVVQGTLGYLDPEYLQTGQLNEKSDVYSFGVVLIELLTGNKAVEFNRPEQRNLVIHFVSSMKEDRLWEILDSRVLGQKKNAEQLKEVALLGRRCVRVNGEERPSMKEVAMELQGLIAMERHPWVKGEDLMVEENEYLLGHHVPHGYDAASATTSAAYDSIQKQIAFDNIADGR